MKKLNELLGTEFPIIQGGMANIATGEFAAACSNAGALGVIATGGMLEADLLRKQIRTCKSLTDKPFGVNLMLMNPCADEMAQIIIEEGVQVVTTGAGSPGKYIPAWKEAGIKVLPVVAASILAKRLVNQGADAIIAEGMESGGIADGRQAAAAFALGACGIQVGTCLLTSRECPIHENYKQAIIKAKDIDTRVTGRTTGHPVRALRNQMTKEYLKKEAEGAPFGELEQLTLGGLRRAVTEGDVKNGSVMSGQIAGLIKEEMSCKDLIQKLMKETETLLKGTAVYE